MPISGSALRTHSVVFFKPAGRWLPDWRFHRCFALPLNKLCQTQFPADSIFSALVIFFMYTCRGPRPSFPPLRTSTGRSARPRFSAAGLAEVLRLLRIRHLFLMRTCGSWPVNTSEQMGATIRAPLRSFESTSTWGGQPPTSGIRSTTLIWLLITVCSGRFRLIGTA